MRTRWFWTVISAFFILTSVMAQNQIIPWTYDATVNVGFTTTQYQAWLYKRVVAGAPQSLPFRLLEPLAYDKFRAQKYPLVIMLHGRGEAGSNNQLQLYWGGKVHQDAVNMINNVTFPGFVVFPQEPYGQWTNSPQFGPTQVTTALSMVFDLVDSLKLKYNIDPNRIYIHGLSSGGSGTWASLYNRPDLFAAALPMSAPGDTSQARKICPTPFWLFQGGIDTNPIPYVSHVMMAAIRAAGATDTTITRYSEYPTVGHFTWINAYADPDFFPYMLRQSKLKVMVFGPNPICPGGKVDLAISANFAQYQWYINTLSTSITGANANRLNNVTTAGNYFAGFKRTPASSWEYTGSTSIALGAYSPKPTVTVNNSLYLPSPNGSSSVALTGPVNQKSYIWSNGASTQSINVNVSGVYTLQAIPLYGCQSYLSDPITVRVGGNGPNIPAIATNLSAFPISSYSILLKWQDNAANETGYEIYRGTQKGGPYSFISVLSVNSTNFIDNNLTPSTTYYYRVRVVNGDGGLLSLEETRATTAKDFIIPTPPSQLQILKFTPSYIQLSWLPSFDSSGIKKYVVYNRDTLMGYSDTTIFNITSLVKGSGNSFRVLAIDNGGNLSSPSNEVPFVYNGVGLFSTYYEGDWSVLPNFTTVKELKNGLVTNFTINTTPPLLINTISGLDFPDKTTKFGIKSNGYIYINATTSGTVYQFFTTSDDGSILWVNNTQVVNNDGLHGMVEQSGNYTFTGKGWYPITAGFFQQGGGYGLQTKYQCISGCIPTSLAGVKLTIPNNVLSYFNTGTTTGVLNPTGQNVSLTGINYYPYSPNDKPRIRLQWSWTPNTFTGIVRGFEIYRIKGGSAPNFTSTGWSKIATVANQPVTPNVFRFVDSTNAPGVFLSGNTTYWYALKGLTNNGNTGLIGYKGTVAKPTFLGINIPNTVPGIPNAPSNLSLSGVSNSVISIFWSDNSNNESGFEVWRSYTKYGIYAKILLVPRGYTTYNDSTCEGNTKYVYKVRAFNAGGYSAFSNIDSTISPNIPTAPSNLKALTTGPNAVNLSWNPNTDIAYGYVIYRSQTSWKTGFTRIDSIPNPGLNYYQDKTLLPNKEYYYKVRAYNTMPSAFSNVDSATTLIDYAPSASDWKLNAVSASTSFDASFNNTINQSKLITTITTKKDFFNYLAITPTGVGAITVKLPPIDSMPQGGIFTFNLAQGSGPASPKGDTINNGTLSFNNDYFGNAIYAVDISLSNNNTTWTVSGLNPVLRKRSNDLQKIDFPASFSGKWMRITFTSKYSYNPNLFLTEVGMYRILTPGTRHNYFIVLGASIEEQNPPMGLAKFRERLSANGYAQGNTALIFNWAISGTNSMQLSDSIAPYLDMHPYASYVMIHQGGNNINNSGNGLRPLKFDMFSSSTSVQLFIQSFTNFYTTILSRGKIPFISRMHFRDYKDGKCSGQLDNSPPVYQGRNQENGSLPYNLIIDSLTRIYAPFAYNNSERRSSVNFYAISLNDQTIMGGDGIHPNNTNMQINKLTDYWVKYVFNYVYSGSFSPPIQYLPGPTNICTITTPQYQDPPCWQKYANCGTVTSSNNIADYPNAPANKPYLMDSVYSAVELAKRTVAGKDIWNAKILVEQIGSTATRIPYVMSLDTLRDYRMPANPTNLSVYVVSNSVLNLSWIRNSLNNTGFEIWRSSTGGKSYKRIGVVTVPSTLSFLDQGLTGDSLYYYYVRAVDVDFRSGWSNIVNARPSSIYYSKSTGNFTDLTTWGKNIDGSGLTPPDFSTSGQTFIISNRGASSSVATDWTVSGNYSKIVVSSSTHLIISAGVNCNATIDVLDNARLDIYGPTNPALGIIDTSSTISFGNSLAIPANNYGNIIFSGSGTRNLPSGLLDVRKNISIDPNIQLQGNNTIINLHKDIIFTDASASLSNVSINIVGDSSTFDAKSGTISLNSLSITGKSNLAMINSSNLLVGSASGGSVIINNGAELYLGNGNLSITGSGILNPGTVTGLLGVNGGSLFINSTGTQPNNLYLDGTLNTLKDFGINLGCTTCQINLYSSLQLSNTLKLSKGVLNTNQFLTLISNNSNTARIAKVESGSNLNGKITVQRYVGPFKTRSTYFLATPIWNQTVSTWSNFILLSGFLMPGTTIAGKTGSVSTYNEARNTWTAMRDSTVLLQPGKGYRVILNTQDLSNADSSGFYANTGIPVIGNGAGNLSLPFTMPLVRSSASGGWNLISNPYPCEIDWEAPSGWNKSTVSNAFYMWDGATRTYKTYIGAGNSSGAVSSSGMTSIINSGQGFLVYSLNSGSSTIGMTEDVKTQTANLPTFYRTGNPDENVLRIFIGNTKGEADEAIVRFVDNATEGFDVDLDALKLEGMTVNVSTLTPIQQSLVINSIPFNTSLTIPVRIQSYDNGAHSLSFRGVENIDNTIKVILKDHYLKTATDLRKNLKYDFDITGDSLTSGNQRFEILFTTDDVTAIANNNSDQSFYVYQNVPNPALHSTTIKFRLPYEDQVEIAIYNSLGQIVEKHSERYTAGFNQYNIDLDGHAFVSSSGGIFFYSVNGCKQKSIKKMIVLK